MKTVERFKKARKEYQEDKGFAVLCRIISDYFETVDRRIREHLHRKGRPKYRFHLMDKDGKLMFRYDNAPHCKVSTFSHHKYTPRGIEESKEVGILDVLNEVEILILKKV